MKHIVIRLDDICPNMNWKNFYLIKEILDKHNIKPLIGVIPNNKDKKLLRYGLNENFWNEMLEWKEAGWLIAQHGYEHRYVSKASGILKIHKRSEFAGLSYDEQFKKIRKGKIMLQEKGIETDIFMAPAHTYDRLTLKALRACGFKYVTDGYSRNPYVYKELMFIPCIHSWLADFDGLCTACIHCNTMPKNMISKFDKDIKLYRDRILDFQEALVYEKTSALWPVEQNSFIFKRWISGILS